MNNFKSLTIENSIVFAILNIVGGLLSSIKSGQPIDPLIITLTIVATVLNAGSSYIRGFVLGLSPELKTALLGVLEGVVKIAKEETTTVTTVVATNNGETLDREGTDNQP